MVDLDLTARDAFGDRLSKNIGWIDVHRKVNRGRHPAIHDLQKQFVVAGVVFDHLSQSEHLPFCRSPNRNRDDSRRTDALLKIGEKRVFKQLKVVQSNLNRLFASHLPMHHIAGRLNDAVLTERIFQLFVGRRKGDKISLPAEVLNRQGRHPLPFRFRGDQTKLGDNSGKLHKDVLFQFSNALTSVGRALRKDALMASQWVVGDIDSHDLLLHSKVLASRRHIALGLSEECGDDEGRGFALLQLAKLTWSEDGKRSEDLLTEAYLAFELANSDQGIALVLQTRGVHVAGLSERERADLLISAADHFQRDDDLRDARRALVMAFVFGGKAMSEDEMHRIGTWCVDICRKSGSLRDEAYCYRQLKQMFCEREDALNEAKYGELEDSLDDALYGSRLARLESDREILVSNIETADNRTEKKRMKLELVELDRAIADERRKGQV